MLVLSLIVFRIRFGLFEYLVIVEVNTYLDVVEQAIDCTRPA